MFFTLPLHTPLRPRTGALLLALAVTLGACGGGGGGAAPTAPAPVQAAVIVTQPATQSVTAGQSVTFTVAATGAALAYQWQRDGKDIAGATGASYTLAGAQAGDDGAGFAVVVRSSAGSVASATATLRVAAAKGLSLVAGGLGGPGNLDGTDGRFQQPRIIAVSPAGVVFVADTNSIYNDVAAVRRSVDIATGSVATIRVEPLPQALVAMAFDAAGNRYELTATAIYKTTPAGTRSLLAGSYREGWADGAGADALFRGTTDLAVDAAGTVYVADSGNRTVRKVTPAGVVSTLAGAPEANDSLDGSGRAAHFSRLSKMAVDRAGNVYVGDAAALRKITPAGAVTTLRATAAGGASPVSFGAVSGMATDSAGNLYVADDGYRCVVRRVGPDGGVVDFAGKYDATGSADGKGDAARFCSAQSPGELGGLSSDAAGNLYVADPYNATIRRITPVADVTTIAGRAALPDNLDGSGAAARFSPSPFAVAQSGGIPEAAYELVTDAQGNVYVGETDRIRKVSGAGVVGTLAAPAGTAAATQYHGAGLAFDGSILDVRDGVVSRTDASGVRRFVAGQAGVRSLVDGAGARAGFFSPSRLIMDGLGNIYLKDLVYHNPAVEAVSSRVVTRRIGPDGVVTTMPEGVYEGPAWYADKDGNVWVAKNDRSVVRIGPDGKSTVLRPPSGSGIDGGLTAITVDRGGNVYVAEAGDFTTTSNLSVPHIVRKITPAGVESIVAGSAATSGVRLGAPGSLGRVDALAAGADGTLYLMSENALLKLVQ